jgi:hypothetical protein
MELIKAIEGHLRKAMSDLDTKLSNLTTALDSCTTQEERDNVLNTEENSYINEASKVLAYLSVTFAGFNSEEDAVKARVNIMTIKSLLGLPEETLKEIGIDPDDKAEIEEQVAQRLSALQRKEDMDIDDCDDEDSEDNTK